MYNLAVYLFLFYAIVCLFKNNTIEIQEKKYNLLKKKYNREKQEQEQKQQFLDSIKY